MHDQRVKQLERHFREAGLAHHDAFQETDGVDPDWPKWYADYLLERVSGLVGQDLSFNELVYLIESAEEDRADSQSDADWPRHYAKFVLRHLG